MPNRRLTHGKYTYSVESLWRDEWCKIFSYSTRDYCDGYLDATRYESPRNAFRVVRSDGKVVREISPNDEAALGMIAGWPTPEQYERAAAVALERAAKIRDRMAREEARK